MARTKAAPAPVAIRPPYTLDLNLPPMELSMNGRMYYKERHRLAMVYHDAAGNKAKTEIPEEQRPYFPIRVVYVRVDIRVERYGKGQRRDFGGMIEALKPVFDGLQGIVYPNDRCVYVGGPVVWDDLPTGEGRIYLTFTGKTIEEALAD